MRPDSSIRRIVEVPGAQFGSAVAVEHVAGVAEQPEEKLRLPGGSRVGLLAQLPRAKDAADREALKVLMGKAFELEVEIEKFAKARFAEQRADFQAEHELAKQRVREQSKVLDNLIAKVHQDGDAWLRADNARRLAQSAARGAKEALDSLSRYASKKEISEAEKRVAEANAKAQTAEAKAAELGQFLNSLKITAVPAENRKLEVLIEAEARLAAQLDGRDPDMAVLGIIER